MNSILNLKITHIFCLILAVCMMFTFCSCKKSGDSDVTSSDATYSVDSSIITDVSDIDSSEESKVDETTVSSENTVSSGTTQNSSSNITQSVVQLPTVTNPEGKEISGAGTKDNPYLDTPDLNKLTVTTVSIPAGKSVHYGIYRVGGMILTINSSSAYVVYNGTTYKANGGKVSFVVGDTMASEAVGFEIGNSGSAPASFVISFANVYGSYSNPESLSKISSKITKNLEAGTETGYYYTYKAEKSGKIRFYMMYSVESIMEITNRGSAATVQKIFAIDSEDTVKDANNNPLYVEIDVKAGEELLIHITAVKDKATDEFPKTKITWYGKYI